MMKKFKKLMAVALVCVMALTLLTACGKTASDYANAVNQKLKAAGVTLSGTEADTKATTEKAQKIVKVVKNDVVSLAQLAAKGNEEALEKEGEAIVKKTGISLDDIKSGKTIICAHVTVSGQQVAVNSVDLVSESVGDASTYFANELQQLSKSGKTIKSIGFEVYNAPMGVANFVVMVAELA